MSVVRRYFLNSILVLCAALAAAQTSPQQGTSAPDPAQSPAKSQGSPAGQTPGAKDPLPPNQAPPRSNDGDSASSGTDDRNFSSSRQNIIDLSPPKDDLKDHPDSAAAVSRSADEGAAADVQEFHQWNPMKALKDVEVGDYYFKRKNYRAAMDRYKEALFYKENDAVATFRLAVCQEQMSDRAGALGNYAAYLKILPHGPFAGEAEASMERLGTGTSKASTVGSKK